jgi:hypothetical protein
MVVSQRGVSRAVSSSVVSRLRSLTAPGSVPNKFFLCDHLCLKQRIPVVHGSIRTEHVFSMALVIPDVHAIATGIDRVRVSFRVNMEIFGEVVVEGRPAFDPIIAAPIPPRPLIVR